MGDMKESAPSRSQPLKAITLRARKRRSGPRLDLLFLGDTSFGENYQERREERGRENILKTRGYDHCLSALRTVLERADFTIANLETPVTDIDASPLAGKKRYIHKADIRLTPEYLKRHRFGAVSLANNHALDYGTEGLAQTLDVLEANGFATFGAGRSRAEAEEPLLLELDSGDMCQSIAVFAGYDHSLSAEAAPGNSTAQLCPLDPARIAHQLRELRAAHPDLLAIAFPHWGENYAWRSNRQRRLADDLVAAGIDVILGHGAHMLQEIETRRGRWVAFSLGNFVFNSPGRYSMYVAPPYSLVSRLIAWPEAATWSIDVRLYPIVSDNERTDWCPRLVSEHEFETVRYLVAAKSDAFQLRAGTDRIGYYLQFRVRPGVEEAARASPR
jgi:hypothetical protein